jgi:hypothetical protein
MIQQFGSDELEWSITNAPPGIPKWGRVKLEDLFGNYSFDFVGANYATGKIQKQRNLMAYYNLAMQSPYAIQGEFLREIARSMDIPFANRLLKTDQQVQQEMQAQTASRQQEELLRELFKIEGKAVVEQIKKPEFMPEGSVTIAGPAQPHGEAIQKQIEEYLGGALESVLGQQPGGPVGPPPIHSVGRPRSAQFEGPIPGVDQNNIDRGPSQAIGKNAMGMAGM